MAWNSVERTLSTLDRTNDKDGIAKETILASKRLEVQTMMADGDLTSVQANIILDAINDYVKHHGNRSSQGFERGLVDLIAEHIAVIEEARRNASSLLFMD
jgi:hypothetical protein